MLKRWLGIFGAAGIILTLAAAPAAAASITFTLDCTMTALATCGPPTGSFGTITLTDDAVNSNWVDISVNLTSPAGRIVNKFFLNYDPAGFPLPSGYAFTALGTLVAAAQNSEGQGVYGMAFDLVFNAGSNPFTTILKLQKASSPDLNLSVFDFNFKDANNQLYAAVNYSGPGSQEGALVSDVDLGITAVPEPATFGLVGLGLFGFSLFRKLRARQQ